MFRIALRPLRRLARPLSSLATPIQSRPHVALFTPRRTLSTVSRVPHTTLRSLAGQIRGYSAYAQPEPYRTLAALFDHYGLSKHVLQQIIDEKDEKKAALLNKLLELAGSNHHLNHPVYLKKLIELSPDTLNKILNLLEKIHTLFVPSQIPVIQVFIYRIANTKDINDVFKAIEKFISVSKTIMSGSSEADFHALIAGLHNEQLLDNLLDCEQMGSVIKLAILVGCNYKTIFENESYSPQVLNCLINEHNQAVRFSGRFLDSDLRKVKPNKALQRVLTEHMTVAEDLLALLTIFSIERVGYETLSAFANNLLISGEKTFLPELRKLFAGIDSWEFRFEKATLMSMIRSNPHQLHFVLELFQMSDRSLAIRSQIIYLDRELLKDIVFVCREITKDNEIHLTPTLLSNVVNQVYKTHQDTKQFQTASAERMLSIGLMGASMMLGLFFHNRNEKTPPKVEPGNPDTPDNQGPTASRH